jgi:hypothetical protein
MTDCKYAGSDRPRMLVDRHSDGCEGGCGGCLPCPEGHCRVCGHAHSDGTCAECMAETREALRDIARMCDSLPEEVEHRGVEGEAMMLLGPAADPEARGHLEASILAGRVSGDYLDAADGELHPLFVTGTWDAIWRDALEHDEPTERLTLPSAVDYLDRQMSYMGGFEHVPFEDFARDLRACRTHLERVLHDGEQVDTGAPCLKCGRRQVREWGQLAAADGWRCPKCKTFSTEGQYRLAVAEEHLSRAEWLTATDCAEWLADEADAVEGVLAVTAGTIRAWATKGKVGKRRDSGRTVYRREDVLVASMAAADAIA